MKIRRRALWGYSSFSVEEALHVLQSNYTESKQRFEKELLELTLQNEQLLEDIACLKEEIAKQK